MKIINRTIAFCINILSNKFPLGRTDDVNVFLFNGKSAPVFIRIVGGAGFGWISVPMKQFVLLNEVLKFEIKFIKGFCFLFVVSLKYSPITSIVYNQFTIQLAHKTV